MALALIGAPSSDAAPILYTFTSTGLNGPLTGAISTGDFSYDSSSITPGAVNGAVGLLTSLNYVWDGITYTSSTANTGRLYFDAGGNLTDFVFGTNCEAFNCSVQYGQQQWFVGGQGGVYDRLGTTTFFSTSTSTTFAQVSEVPEPSTFGVVGTGLAGILLAALRRRRV